VGGRSVQRSVYRPDPWGLPEWRVAGSGVVAAALMAVQAGRGPDALSLPLQPLGAPALPLLAVLGILVAALPAFVAPDSPVARRGATR
ncbi:MAG: energy-coupling factor transporter transmembrane protein EcfT, partial [Pedococcus sp.]